jgi:hypothetical protein
MLNYLGLEYASALLVAKHLCWYWRRKNTIGELLGNTFFKRVMSGEKFLLIRRAFQANLEEFMSHYNKSSQKYWNPGEKICIDDDLEKSEAQSSETMHVASKA